MTSFELQQVAKLLKKVAEHAMVPHLKELDLTKAEMIIMDVLTKENRLSVRELTKRAGMPQSQVSSTVARLVNRTWVTTETDPKDKRSTLVITQPIVAKGMRKAFSQDPIKALIDEVPDLSIEKARELDKLVMHISQIIKEKE